MILIPMRSLMHKFIHTTCKVVFRVSFNKRMNKLYNYELMIKTIPYFILLFTIMHYIDGESYFKDSIFSNLPKNN